MSADTLTDAQARGLKIAKDALDEGRRVSLSDSSLAGWRVGDEWIALVHHSVARALERRALVVASVSTIQEVTPEGRWALWQFEGGELTDADYGTLRHLREGGRYLPLAAVQPLLPIGLVEPVLPHGPYRLTSAGREALAAHEARHEADTRDRAMDQLDMIAAEAAARHEAGDRREG